MNFKSGYPYHKQWNHYVKPRRCLENKYDQGSNRYQIWMVVVDGWWWWVDFPITNIQLFCGLLTFFCRPFVSLMEGLDWLKVIKNIKKCTSSAYWSNETWEYQCVNERSLWKRNTFPCVNLLPGCFPDGEYFVLFK